MNLKCQVASSEREMFGRLTVDRILVHLSGHEIEEKLS